VTVLFNKTFAARAATPTIAPASGTYVGAVTVAMSDATSGAAIHFTTDGSVPTGASPVYTGPILITRTTTVRAIATATGMVDSDVASAAYTIRAAPPAVNPPAGTYVGSVTVSMTAANGATIRYTTDGSAPTAASAAYTGPIVLTRSTTVRAIATATGMADSTETSAAYVVAAVAPTFSPAAATYSQPQSVTLSTTTSGATMYYTTDGSTPTTSSTPYTGAIAVNRSMTLRAIATASGMANSAVAVAAYTLQAATPTFNPPGGSYLLPQMVSISDASPGVTIYYTTDGSTPTTSSTRYTGSFLVGVGTTTVRAIAVAPGWSQSAVASVTYSVLVLF
jgi:Chitobiase/beta-hexosaminidase C-terminal domain